MARKALWGACGLTLFLAAAVFVGGLACRKNTSGQNNNAKISSQVSRVSEAEPEPSKQETVAYAPPVEQGSYMKFSSRNAPMAGEILTDHSGLAVARVLRRGNLEGRLIGYSGGNLSLIGVEGIESMGRSCTATFRGDSFFFQDVRPGTYSLTCKSDFSQYVIMPTNPDTIFFGRREVVSGGVGILAPDSDIQVRTLDCFFGGEVNVITKGNFFQDFIPALESMIQRTKPRLILYRLGYGEDEPFEFEIIKGKFGGMVPQEDYKAYLVYGAGVGKAEVSGKIELPTVSLKGFTNAQVFIVADKKPIPVSFSFAASDSVEFALLDLLPHTISSKQQADSFYHYGGGAEVIPGVYVYEGSFCSSGKWRRMAGCVSVPPGCQEISFINWQSRNLMPLGRFGTYQRDILGQLGESHSVHSDTFDLSFGWGRANFPPESSEKQVRIDEKDLVYSLSSEGMNALRLRWRYGERRGVEEVGNNFEYLHYVYPSNVFRIKEPFKVMLSDELSLNLNLYKYVWYDASNKGNLEKNRCTFRARAEVEQTGMGAVSVWCDINNAGDYLFRTELVPGPKRN